MAKLAEQLTVMRRWEMDTTRFIFGPQVSSRLLSGKKENEENFKILSGLTTENRDKLKHIDEAFEDVTGTKNCNN
jgi:hypothetical protein